MGVLTGAISCFKFSSLSPMVLATPYQKIDPKGLWFSLMGLLNLDKHPKRYHRMYKYVLKKGEFKIITNNFKIARTQQSYQHF